MAGFERAYLFEAGRWVEGLYEVVGTDAHTPVMNPAVAATVVALPLGLLKFGRENPTCHWTSIAREIVAQDQKGVIIASGYQLPGGRTGMQG